MNPILKLYYILTAYIPRRLPRNEAEYAKMKRVLLHAYGIKDTEISWSHAAGQVTSTQANRIRRPWGEIANAVKRLDINKVAHDEKLRAVTAFSNEMQAKADADALANGVKDDKETTEVLSITDDGQKPQTGQITAQDGAVHSETQTFGFRHPH